MSLSSATAGTATGIGLGIDGGGSAIRAEALSGGRTVYEASGGPGNAASTPAAQLERHLVSVLAGCPEPQAVLACFAGAGLPRGRRLIERTLKRLFPRARRRVVPDYVAAWAASPAGTDVAVIVGTGSAICSPGEDGRLTVSGGRGWIVGDHGSATRLGRALVEHYCLAPREELSAALEGLFGSAEPERIVAALMSSPTPQLLLARAAPALTAAAANGDVRCGALLASEMEPLAATIAGHLRRCDLHGTRPTLALSGGVLTSGAARRALHDSLLAASVEAELLHAETPHVQGAARLAAELCDE